ncbi:MAG: alkaline phosphatase [Hyphomicrobiales bacterium]|nr:MAG: alkaline phosphatase [Hyphomicrobiales bacterium]
MKLAVCLGTALLVGLPLAAEAQERPRLILQITVDQLRGDLPLRHMSQFGEGGFRYLLEKGVYYNDAHHAHANTETVVGHTTLATGAHPAAHGMIGNLWFDRNLGRTVYNVEDANYKMLSAGAGVNAKTEVDPTQLAAATDGRSPASILTSTFSDELSIATQGRAKVFGVSVKDRGAVSMAGHTGKAFWFSKSTGKFVTSSYYYDDYPGWVKNWNDKDFVQKYLGTSWELLQPLESYVFKDRDDQPWEPDFEGFGRVFPHPFSTIDPLAYENDPYFLTFLTFSPAGDQITADFAKTLIKAEALGEDDVTDYLSVSFSSTYYVGHVFGPSSLEAEDNLLQLDRTLADLLAFVDAEIGLDKTLIVLSADHGTPEAPGFLRELGKLGGYVSPDQWDTTAAAERVRKKFGLTGKLIQGYDHPYLTLSEEVRNAEGVDLSALQTAISEELNAFEGVAYAVPSARLIQGSLPDNGLTRTIVNNFNPDRSGDIYVVFDPGWFINDFDGVAVTVTHGSPWRHDTYVPIVFAGFGLSPQKVSRRVHTVDVAITLSAIAGARPPDGAAGNVLAEVVGQ